MAESAATLFRDCRVALGMTQTELAEKLWVGLRSVQHWEMGDREAPGPVWQLLLLMLRRPHEALARRIEKLNPYPR